MKKFFLPIFFLAILFLPAVSSALELDYPEWGPEGEKIRITLDTNLNQLVAWFYYFIVGIAGLSAFAMIVWGGVEWLISAGSPARITSAKDKLTSALIGLLIILASWLILQTINPDLVILNLEPL